MKNRSKSPDKHFTNNRGIIAENYRELQAVHILEELRKLSPYRRGSENSIHKTVLQATEVAILNIENLLRRATEDIQAEQFGKAMAKLKWINGFNRVLIELGLLYHKIPLDINSDVMYLSIMDSPSYNQLYETLQAFDRSVLSTIDFKSETTRSKINTTSFEDTQTSLIHLIKVFNQDSTIWEHALAKAPINETQKTYYNFVLPDKIHQAVYDRSLKGDTFFMQFRGLHQIPELLTFEINDLIEEAILSLRQKSLLKSLENLHWANEIGKVVLSTLPPIIDDLSTSDYHTIRENLGLTSGSHSVNLHFHLFRDLYEQLANEILLFLKEYHPGSENHEIMIKQITRSANSNLDAFLQNQLIDEALNLRSFTRMWRDWHIHLPRNNLGGNGTKSLTGSPDAVEAVRRMRTTAFEHDAMKVFASAKDKSTNVENGVLATYFASDISLDHLITNATGEATKEAFQDVQKRLGVFANKTPFTPPAHRKV